MAPSPLTPTVRYIPPGTRKIYWVTTIATYTAPTRSELNAGIDLSAEIDQMSGFNVKSDSVETPDLSTRFTSKIPGKITSDASSVTFYASSTSSDVRTVLPRDTAGFMVILPEGDVTGQKMDVFPSKVAAATVDTNLQDPGKVMIDFTITKVPAQNVTIP